MVRLCKFGLLLPLVLTGCAVHLIAPYDPVLDQTMVGVQQDTEFFFNRMAEAQGVDADTYARNAEFYLRTEATLTTLLLRAQAVPKSTVVADQLRNLEATVERMQATHRRDGTLSPTLIGDERAILQSEFRSFFALQFALKNHFNKPVSTPATAPALRAGDAGGAP